MQVVWSDFASNNLRAIFRYHKDVAGITIAKKMKNKILATSSQLKAQPHSGQIELLLEHLGESHRYLVVGNYKLVYKIEQDIALITDLFDTRQNPQMINNSGRNI